MRTRFVIHKNLLSPVYRVRTRPVLAEWTFIWNPEDICVENPERVETNGFFILPKSEYVACDKNGVVKDKHVDSAYFTHCGSEQNG